LSVTAGVPHHNFYSSRYSNRDGGNGNKLKFQSSAGQTGNKWSSGHVSGSLPQNRGAPVYSNYGNSNNPSSSVVRNNAAADQGATGSSDSQRPQVIQSSVNTNMKLISCWTCGEFGHTAAFHKGSGKNNKPPPQGQAKVKSTPVNAVDTVEKPIEIGTLEANHCSVAGINDDGLALCGSAKITQDKYTNKVDVGFDPGDNFQTEVSETEQAQNKVPTDAPSVTSSLSYEMLEVEKSPRSYMAMIDSGTMIAVAKSSLVPDECREYLGKTRFQGAFGERVEADLVTLKVRLHSERTDAETPYIPVMFALTDALATQECDILLPAHAANDLRVYNEICVMNVEVDCDADGECMNECDVN